MAKNAKKIEIPATPAKQAPGVDVAALRAIGEATRSGGFLYVSPEAKPLVDLGLIAVNLEMTDENGNPAAKITEVGEGFLANYGEDETPASEAAPVVAAGKPSFEVMSGFTIPEVKRASGGGAQSIYPFEKLEVGQFFFIPNSADKPHAAKDYASTVSSANGRLQPKRFKIVVAYDADGKETGANVGRLPDYDEAGLIEARERSAKRAAARQATKAAKATPASEAPATAFVAA
jgi:hypothetical protein